MKEKTIITTTTLFVLATLAIGSLLTPAYATPVSLLLDPLTIPKYTNQLTGPPPVYIPTVVTDKGGNIIRYEYTVSMTSFSEQILPPGYPTTPVWGYGGIVKDAVTGAFLGFIQNSPGPTFETVRGIPAQVTWRNTITTPHMFAVDPTIHWADPNNLGTVTAPFNPYPPGYAEAQSNVPLVTHLHDGEVSSCFDGGPNAWFTADGKHGPDYCTTGHPKKNEATYYYPNVQQPTTLWYHDHALGITRINVMSGLAGFYLLREPADTIAPYLPTGKYEVPLAIQDRSFYTDGSFYFPSDGVNPDIHPYWAPEFFGNTIMVNGKVWPNMNVDRAMYRFRLLDGSNARFYTLTCVDQTTNMLIPFVQIGADSGYLMSPAPLTQLTIAPGERADVLISFRNLSLGTKVLVKNTAKTPFPSGSAPDPRTTGQIMQFTVTGPQKPLPPNLRTNLNPNLPTYPSLPTPTKQRILTLFEVQGPEGPIMVTLNGQMWDAPVTELPVNGSTEDWVIVNLTEDAHPIHLHLVQFELISRQRIAKDSYMEDWISLQQQYLGDPEAEPPWPMDYTPVELSVGPYLIGNAKPAPANEQGFKDTVQMFPGEVTIIRVRWASADGSPYPFDPTQGPGYVWHCHILDHEDNEMMRPYKVVS